jgi:hypothetical protein
MAVLALTFVSATVGACSQRARPESPRNLYRAAAIITFGTGDNLLDAFAIPEVEIAEWSHATWTNVPLSGSSAITAYTLTPTVAEPVLFFVHRQPEGISIRVIRVNAGLPPRTSDGDPVASAVPVPSWCDSESWIGAFFIDGVGSPAEQPVILEYRGDTSDHRLLVDPRQSTVRANPGIVVTDAQLRILNDDGVYRVVSVQLARTLTEAFPLLVQMVGQSAKASYGGRPLRISWSASGGQLDPQAAWRVYFLSAIPGSEPRLRETPRCDFLDN